MAVWPPPSVAPESSDDPPQPAAVAATSSASASVASRIRLGRALVLGGALALRSLALGADRRDRGLLMAPATIPDHIGLRHALLRGLGLDLPPRQLRLGQIVPAGEVERLEGAFQGRSSMF